MLFTSYHGMVSSRGGKIDWLVLRPSRAPSPPGLYQIGLAQLGSAHIGSAQPGSACKAIANLQLLRHVSAIIQLFVLVTGGENWLMGPCGGHVGPFGSSARGHLGSSRHVPSPGLKGPNVFPDAMWNFRINRPPPYQ